MNPILILLHGRRIGISGMKINESNTKISHNIFNIEMKFVDGSLATLHYWTGRFVVICLMLFYLINFEELNILKIKTYLKITSYKKIKTILLIFMCMTFILILFYPGNIFLLFTPEFLYPSFRKEIFHC